MSVLNNMICANGLMIGVYVFDAILILTAIGLSVWFYKKYGKSRSNGYQNQRQQTNVERIDDDTYVINPESDLVPEMIDEYEQVPEQPQTNVVEKFATQITEINEPLTNELKSNTVVMNKPVEVAEKKIVKKEEIENFVMLDGVKKTLTEPEKQKTFNRGANAFTNSTNFLNSIKEEQAIGGITKTENVTKPVQTKKSTAKTTSKSKTTKK